MEPIDTIVALSTPPGRSGIGVIRLSGPDALPLTRSLLHENVYDPEPNRVILKGLRDPENGEVLDRVLLTYFKSPHSYTGEDVVELSCHGSPPLLLRIIDALLFAGARAADPGEFTLRALSNGRLNLTQAEAVRDLIDAHTHAAVRLAARQLGGELSTRLQPIKDSLVEIIVPLESSLEFVEDDLPEDITRHLAQKLSALRRQLEDFAGTYRHGRLLKEGLRVTLIGRPNVGKSTIFNQLLKNDRAIVTDIPGTTRDTLSEVINIKDVPVMISDTAGIRVSQDKVEQMGVERTRRAIVDADLLVVVIDGSGPLAVEDQELMTEASENRHLIVVNKSDLGQPHLEDVKALSNGVPVISISAKTGSGFDSLREAILEPFSLFDSHETSFVITNARHYDLMRRTADALQASQSLLEERVSEELVLVGLYDALRLLGEITGETTAEDVLSEIFSTFCIGK
jgi:tRNA modification GTPase